MKKIGIVMGSDSDLGIAEKAAETLKELGVPFEVHVYSAHRTPEQAAEFSKTAREKRFRSYHSLRRQSSPPGRRAGSQYYPACYRSTRKIIDFRRH